MTILITGGTGYIGSHVAISLIDAGYSVVLFDNLSNSDISTIDRLEKITHQKITFIEGDVRDTEMISSILFENKIKVVMHFAGHKAVGESEENPIKYYDNNVAGSISLLKAMQKNQVKKIIFSSSATVYGFPQYLPYDESHPTSPFNTYGRNKLFIEEILRDLASSDSEWIIAILRYFNPVGAHDSGLIGEMPRGTPNNLMPFLTQVASGRLKNLNVFGNDYDTQDGTGGRDYIHVVDLAEGHLAALKFINDNYKAGQYTINLGTGKSTTVLELIHAFENVNNIKIPINFVERRLGDLPNYYASADYAFKILNWKANRTIEQMCESSWRWEKSRGI